MKLNQRRKAAKQNFDVLLAIMPSALTQPQMDNLIEYVKAGKPTLIFDDPCPFVFQNQSGLAMAPRLAETRWWQPDVWWRSSAGTKGRWR